MYFSPRRPDSTSACQKVAAGLSFYALIKAIVQFTHTRCQSETNPPKDQIVHLSSDQLWDFVHSKFSPGFTIIKYHNQVYTHLEGIFH